jgi:hypothetical protein
MAVRIVKWTDPTGSGPLSGVLQQVAVDGVYLLSIPGDFPGSLLPPPSLPQLSTTAAGTLAAATYFVRTTFVSAGGESLPSPEAVLAVPANNELVVASPTSVPAGVTGWNVYVSNGPSGTEQRQNASPIAIGTNWTQSAVPSAGASLPTSSLINFLRSHIPGGSCVIVRAADMLRVVFLTVKGDVDQVL